MFTGAANDLAPIGRCGGRGDELFALLLVLTSTLVLLSVASVRAGDLSLLTGAVLNGRTPLVLHQAGWPEVRMQAEFRTRPLSFPLYYAVRWGFSSRGGLEAELIHDKLYLRNRPAEVQAFAVTHGFNLLLLNLCRRASSWTLRIGCGVVASHPETTVRGRRHEEDQGLFGAGYYLSGPAGQLALQRQKRLERHTSLLAEVKLTLARARFPIAGGHACLVNPAVHFLLGVSFAPGGLDKGRK